MNMNEQSFLSMPAGGINAVKRFKNGNSQSVIEQGRMIAKNLGVSYGAGFLRNKGFSVEMCLFALLGK